MPHSATVFLEFGKLNDAIIWCIDNCKHKWVYHITSIGGQSAGEYTFVFDDVKDYSFFKLKFT